MSTRRLEEILEECVSAYLEGRRSIEESLSLYPAFAAQLEPLLRTAAGLNYTIGSYSPPAYVQQRGLNRFLSDARARRNMRTMRVPGNRPGVLASFWERTRVGFAAAALAIVVTAGALGAVLMVGNSGGDTTVRIVSQTPAPGTPTAVLNLTTIIDTIQGKLDRGEKVERSEIARLTAATNALQPDEVAQAKDFVTQALTDANTLLPTVVAAQPDLAPEAADAQDTVSNIASANHIDLPSTPAIGTASPATTPEATPTATPVETEPGQTESPTPAATDTVTPVPTPEPSPTFSPPPRDLG